MSKHIISSKQKAEPCLNYKYVHQNISEAWQQKSQALQARRWRLLESKMQSGQHKPKYIPHN